MPMHNNMFHRKSALRNPNQWAQNWVAQQLASVPEIPDQSGMDILRRQGPNMGSALTRAPGGGGLRVHPMAVTPGPAPAPLDSDLDLRQRLREAGSSANVSFGDAEAAVGMNRFAKPLSQTMRDSFITAMANEDPERRAAIQNIVGNPEGLAKTFVGHYINPNDRAKHAAAVDEWKAKIAGRKGGVKELRKSQGQEMQTMRQLRSGQISPLQAMLRSTGEDPDVRNLMLGGGQFAVGMKRAQADAAEQELRNKELYTVAVQSGMDPRSASTLYGIPYQEPQWSADSPLPPQLQTEDVDPEKIREWARMNNVPEEVWTAWVSRLFPDTDIDILSGKKYGGAGSGPVGSFFRNAPIPPSTPFGSGYGGY